MAGSDILHLREEVDFLSGTEIELKSYSKESGWVDFRPVTGGKYSIPTENVQGIERNKKW